MKRFIPHLAAVTLVLGVSRAAPLDDLGAAAQRLADAPNYSWTSAEKNVRGSFPATTKDIVGLTEKDGFTVIKSTMKASNTLTEVRIYWGSQMAYLRDGSWKTAEELQAAAGRSSGITVIGTGVANSGRGIGMMTVASQNEAQTGPGRPAQMLLSLLPQVKGLTLSGGEIVGELSYDYIARVMRGNGRNGPLVVAPSSSGSVKFWIKDGEIAKFQIKLKASYENADQANERTTTVEVKNVGTTVVAVPVEAKAKFKM